MSVADALLLYSPLIVFAILLAYIALFVAPEDDS